MKNDTLKYIFAGILFGGFAVWLTSITIINSNSSGMMQMMGFNVYTQQGRNQNSNNIDAHFIEQMIPHHEDAITMAKLALTKTTKPEVKQLAESIIDSQSKEINQMETWYKNWFGTEVPKNDQVMNRHGMMGGNSMHMGMMGDESDITRLTETDDFDKAFVEEMIPHHQMAVMMAQMLKNGTDRPEMKKLADEIITAQTREIDEMRDWYTEWGF